MPGRLGSYLLHGMDGLYTLVGGSFTCVNGAAPTIRSGKGFTVARTGEGHWTVTVTDASGIAAVIIGQARETLPGSDLAEHVEFVLDQDGTTGNAFVVKAYLLDDISSANAPAIDDQDGAEVHFIALVEQTT